MNASLRAAAFALALACGSSACSSGGGAAPAPPLATTSPLGHATGTLTILYPSVSTLKAGGSLRSPRFVDPNGAFLTFDDAAACCGPAADILTKIAVAPGPGGTQTATIPLIAGDSYLVVHEYDAGSNLLAQGVAFLSGTTAGSTQALAVTLNMVVVGVAITTDAVTKFDLTALSQTSGSPTVWNSCNAVNGPSYLIPYDAANSYVVSPTTGVGLGGIPPAQITSQVADNNGTTRLFTDAGGRLRVAFDALHQGVTAVVQVFDSSNSVQTTAYLRYTYRGC